MKGNYERYNRTKEKCLLPYAHAHIRFKIPEKSVQPFTQRSFPTDFQWFFGVKVWNFNHSQQAAVRGLYVKDT